MRDDKRIRRDAMLTRKPRAAILPRLCAAIVLTVLSACVGSTPPGPAPAPTNTTAAPTPVEPTNTAQPTATPVSVASATPESSATPTRTLTRTVALPIVSGGAEPTATTQSEPPLPRIALGDHGINVADYTDMALPRDLGFGWVQVFNPPEFPIDGFKILYRVPLGNAINGKAEDIGAWADALESLARDRQGVINAYSIGNEVNLSREWGGGQPDPWAYTQLLAIAYARIKQADPDALVISSGIAPTGGDGDGFVDDLKYARAMFESGALDVLDAYGFHPYGFAYEPERDPSDPQAKGLLFRRAEAHRKLMEEFGAADKQMWATEFGWLIDPQEEGSACTLQGMDWQRVSRQRQASYVIRAYDYAAQNWAWMGPMFLWNLDFSRSPLYPDPCEQMKWFSLLDAAGNQRPIAQALRDSRR